MMLRYQVREEGVAEVAGAVASVFDALESRKPKGVRYAYGRRAGSTELVAVLALDEGVENPLLGIPEARQLQAAVAKWVIGDAPMAQPIEMLGSYGAKA